MSEQRLTAYKSQITLANASTLNDDLHKHKRPNSSKVLRDIAMEGVASGFPR